MANKTMGKTPTRAVSSWWKERRKILATNVIKPKPARAKAKPTKVKAKKAIEPKKVSKIKKAVKKVSKTKKVTKTKKAKKR